MSGFSGRCWGKHGNMCLHFVQLLRNISGKNDGNNDGPWKLGRRTIFSDKPRCHQMSVVFFSQCDNKDTSLKDTSLGSVNFPICWVDVSLEVQLLWHRHTDSSGMVNVKQAVFS